MNIPDPHLPFHLPLRLVSAAQRVGGADESRFGSNPQREFAEMLFPRALQQPQTLAASKSAAAQHSTQYLSTLEFTRRHAVMTSKRGAKRAAGLEAYL